MFFSPIEAVWYAAPTTAARPVQCNHAAMILSISRRAFQHCDSMGWPAARTAVDDSLALAGQLLLPQLEYYGFSLRKDCQTWHGGTMCCR
jgi:hypothetical protein